MAIWDDFFSRLSRRGGDATGEAGSARSSASSKGSVSMTSSPPPPPPPRVLSLSLSLSLPPNSESRRREPRSGERNTGFESARWGKRKEGDEEDEDEIQEQQRGRRFEFSPRFRAPTVLYCFSHHFFSRARCSPRAALRRAAPKLPR
jgi:hypothetical protein